MRKKKNKVEKQKKIHKKEKKLYLTYTYKVYRSRTTQFVTNTRH